MVIKRQKQKQISFGYCDTVSGQRVYPEPPPSDIAVASSSQQQHSDKELALHPTDKNDGMYLKVTSSPSLGRATTISRSQHSVRFSVLLETTASSSQTYDEPQVSIWHNHGGHQDWAELPLKPTTDGKDVLLLNRPQDRSTSRQWFTAELSGLPKHGQVVSFTVKFLVDTKQGWRWVKDTTGVDDGELHYQGADYEKHSSYDLKHWFDGISDAIEVETEKAETDDTYLYSLTCPISPAEGQDSGWQQHQLGLPSRSSRWFSLVRLWAPWLAPRQGKGQLDLDKDAVLLSFLREDGLHVVALGISAIENTITTFVHDRHGNVIIKGRNDETKVGTARVLVAVAPSFEVANAAVFYHARKVVHALGTDSDDVEGVQEWNGPEPEWLEEWYDGLTYCTWNGLGQNLTSKKILDALDTLSKENINVTNLIIDDNWQSLSKGDTQFVRGWSEFEANKEGFPDGLEATTKEIRKRHPNINHIAVWHALLGYWGGIDPNGKIAKDYKTIEVEKEPGVAGGTFTVVAGEDASSMYDDFYEFLSSAGIDSVKTDAQCFLDFIVHAPDRRNLTTRYQDAWTVAHLRHFSARAISCMSQSPQILFHSQLPTNQPRLLVRNSDDFFPEVPASHAWHIFCNAHNSLLTQHLNVLPDWDMFQTSHEWGSCHAAARCISGGPIYFTDIPGQHDAKLIGQMTAKTLRDKTIILRPDMVGKSIDPYNGDKALALLKIGTYVGYAQTGSGILGIFNLSGQHLSEFVQLHDFPGTEQGEYVVGSFTSGEVSAPMSRDQNLAMVGLELENRRWDILTAYALSSFTVRQQTVKIALMGLIGKMTGSAAITGRDAYVEENGRLRIWTSLKALGVLGIYISDLPARNVADFMVMISGQPIPRDTVRKNEADKHVLEIDIEKAWKESGEKAGWSNEISLEIFFH